MIIPWVVDKLQTCPTLYSGAIDASDNDLFSWNMGFHVENVR